MQINLSDEITVNITCILKVETTLSMFVINLKLEINYSDIGFRPLFIWSGHLLKAGYTFGKCQTPVSSLGESQDMHKITNL